MLVKEELHKLGIEHLSINLGVVEIKDDEISDDKRNMLRANLKNSGLELLENKKLILVEKIKSVIIEMINFTDDLPLVNDSEYISSKLGYDYTYLSNTFRQVKGITIQHYIIILKIERVKELLFYEELTLTEIAWILHYSSVAHLFNQFKKVTGVTPSYFKQKRSMREDMIEYL